MLLNVAEMLLDVAQMLPNFLPEFHIRFQKLSKSNPELRKFADLFNFIEQFSENRAEKASFFG